MSSASNAVRIKTTSITKSYQLYIRSEVAKQLSFVPDTFDQRYVRSYHDEERDRVLLTCSELDQESLTHVEPIKLIQGDSQSGGRITIPQEIRENSSIFNKNNEGTEIVMAFIPAGGIDDEPVLVIQSKDCFTEESYFTDLKEAQDALFDSKDDTASAVVIRL